MDIPASLRTGFDYVFVLKENIMANKKRLFEHYCGIFPNYDMFCQCLDFCTENYGCIVIDCRNISNDVNDVVYWYKADYELANKPFRVGCDAFWGYHKNNYNSGYDNEEEDPTKRAGKRGLRMTKQY